MAKRNSSANYLEFYQAQGIIPTTQDVSNWDAHVRTRLALYSHLGLPPAAFQGSDVLEIGPGTGQNALVLMGWSPKSITLVDANPASLTETKARFKASGSAAKFVLSKAEEYSPKTKFDIVLCEGMIPALPNPPEVFQAVLRHVKPGGVVVITCMDPIALVPEMLRRWAARKLISPADSIQEQAAEVANLFAKDFSFLKGMTRLREDWAMDNIIRPWGNKFFPIPEALAGLSGSWFVQGASPHFLQDWRWHKALAIEETPSLDNAMESYDRFSPNFMDTRMGGIGFAKGAGRKISKLCQKTCDTILSCEPKHAKGETLSNLVTKIAELYTASPETVKSLTEFARFAETPNADYRKLREFPKLWGRGQQYLSLQKS